MRKILVTGAAGFIGFHVCRALLVLGESVTGIDNLNPYYDVSLKKARLEILRENEKFDFIKVHLEDCKGVQKVIGDTKFDVVVHLAAQAGVRYSLDNPMAYVDTNIVGFTNILEGCRHNRVGHLVYASSSSVYGANKEMPFSEKHNVDHPISLYAATKKANELMAHTYSALFKLPTTGLRFFTVYGPWGRPDMALFKFTKAILEGESIDVFNYGDMRRDFTYIDDVVNGVIKVMSVIPEPDHKWNPLNPNPDSSFAPYRIYNIGNNNTEALLDMIEVLEGCLGKKAKKNMMPMQLGDVQETSASIEELRSDAGFEPKIPIRIGIPKFVEWYREYYKV